MVAQSLTFLAKFREESSFLPSITFGYLYTRGADLPVCSFGIDVPYISFSGLSSVSLLFLTVVSLGTASGAYTIAKSNISASRIRNSASSKFGYFLDAIVIVDTIFTFIAPLALLLHICRGDLIVNTLLLIQVALISTTIWSILLDQYTEVEGIKEMTR